MKATKQVKFEKGEKKTKPYPNQLYRILKITNSQNDQMFKLH